MKLIIFCERKKKKKSLFNFSLYQFDNTNQSEKVWSKSNNNFTRRIIRLNLKKKNYLS